MRVRLAIAFASFAAFFTCAFLPAERGGRFASGDALLETLPAFLGAHHLWEPSLLLGYPMFADPNQQLWYPLTWLAALPGSYGVFAFAPFTLAAFGTFGFVFTLTRSDAAAAVAGLTFGLGGFLVSHAGHQMLDHPAAWVPYVFWAIEVARRPNGAGAVPAGGTALALCALAGQPQIATFALTLAAPYVLAAARDAPSGTRVFLVRAANLFGIGLALAGVQLIPEAVLAHDSTRATLPFELFALYAVPVADLALRLAFPYAVAPTTFTEQTIAVGLVPLVLACAAFAALRSDARVAFWWAVALGALLLAVGDATPLAHLTHRLPIYGLFRAPGRQAFAWTFAVAVLAGYGAAAIVRGTATRRALACGITVVAIVVAAAAAERGLASPDAGNLAFVLPAATGLAGIALVLGAAWSAGARAARAAGIAVAAAVALDMAGFAQGVFPDAGAAGLARLAPSLAAEALGAHARAAGTRLAAPRGTLDAEVPPNLTSLWNVDALDGYTPLVPRRVASLLGITLSGGVTLSADPRDVRIDVAGANPLAVAPAAAQPVTAAAPFAPDDLHVFLGPLRPETNSVPFAAFGVATAARATGVAVVSELGDALLIPQGARVADLTAIDATGRRETHVLLAGRDTAEFAYDRADVRPLVRHGRATIFDGDATTHRYRTYVPLTTRAPIARIEVAWRYPSTDRGAMTLEKLSLVDGRGGSAVAFGPLATFYGSPDHWRPLGAIGNDAAFENRRAAPRVWLARPTAVSGDEALVVLRTGTLPNGRAFDPRRDAVVEGTTQEAAPAADDRAVATGATWDRVDIATRCERPCFLVMRDALDPAWVATIDDRAAPQLATDVALRGVALPAGIHRVAFRFVPVSLFAGAAVSALGLVWAAIVAGAAARRFRQPADTGVGERR